MMSLRIFCSFILAVATGTVTSAHAATHEQFDGEVVGIADGDTLSVTFDGMSRKIRLSGIDSPEKSQAFGQRAKQYTSELSFGKQVHVEVLGKDRYGRAISEVTLADGRNLNDLVLENGYAWWYQKYSPSDAHRCALQTKARDERVGLWSDSRPQPPWDYRSAAKSQRYHHE